MWQATQLDLLLAAAHTTRHFALEFRMIFAPFLGGVHIGRRLVIGIGQHGDDREQYGLHGVYGQPAFLGLLVAPLIVAGLVQYGDADIAVLLNIRMPDLGDEFHAWRPQWVLFGKD